MVPVTITDRTGVFDIPPPVTNLESTTFIQELGQQGRNFSQKSLTGYKTTSGTYKISAQFCKPSGSHATYGNPTVQILTHGIGFDKTYWDLPFANYNYSYVDVATDKYGYYTLAYDRLGIGKSQHAKTPQGTVDEIQASLEIQALRSLTMMLRAGKFPNVNHAFSKVTHVGHSFGAGQTYALTALYPGISDGIALTGFSLNSSFIGNFLAGGNFQQAVLNQPRRFGRIYPKGYMVSSNIEALQFLFLLPGYFNPALEQYGEMNKQPVTAGELLTLGSVPLSSKFSGPALVLTGSNDLPFCGGNCFATGGQGRSIPGYSVKPALAHAKPFEAYIQPKTGHGINFHYNATGAYNVINKFFSTNGLASA